MLKPLQTTSAHSHIHAIVAEGVFTDSGYFVHIPEIWKHRAAEFWQERVFRLLLDKHKINDKIAEKKKPPKKPLSGVPEPDTPFRRKWPIKRWQKDEYYLWNSFFKVCWSTFALQKIKSVVIYLN